MDTPRFIEGYDKNVQNNIYFTSSVSPSIVEGNYEVIFSYFSIPTFYSKLALNFIPKFKDSK